VGRAGQPEASIVYEIRRLDSQRYVGDTSTMTVHDRWHPECDDTLMKTLVRAGTAVAFEPDDLDQAFYEGFDYCSECFDKTEPLRPAWARG
jgi:hypothetical protein